MPDTVPTAEDSRGDTIRIGKLVYLNDPTSLYRVVNIIMDGETPMLVTCPVCVSIQTILQASLVTLANWQEADNA
jgi:hypothetical protein